MELTDQEIPVVVLLKDNDTLGTQDVVMSKVYATLSGSEVELDTEYYSNEISNSFFNNTSLVSEFDTLSYSYDSTKSEFVTDQLDYVSPKILTASYVSLLLTTLFEIDTELFLTNWWFDIFRNIEMVFRINLGVIPRENDTYFDILLSNEKFYSYLTDTYCCTATTSGILVDVVQQSGRLIRGEADAYNSGLGISGIYLDLYNASMVSGTLPHVENELTSHSGSITYFNGDVYCTSLGLSAPVNCDIKTRSIFVSDFFLDVDKFTTASSTAWIDVVDFLYPIHEEDIKLLVNDTVVSGVWFSDIPNGKRVHYDPINDFYSDGVCTYTLQAASSIDEYVERTYYLLYGYNIELDEAVHWPPGKDVIVRAEADNLVFCKNKQGEVFKFKTLGLSSVNLPCTIRPVGYVDIGASIFPQSTAFYYGKTYTVKLKNVKDYSGNVLPDFEYTFTIENPDEFN